MKNLVFTVLSIPFAAALLSCFSCSQGEVPATAAAIGQMFTGSSEAVLFLGCKAVSEDEIEFEFSQEVSVKSLKFDPQLDVISIEDGTTVRVKLDESLGPGIRIKADILAEDAERNTINVLVPFRTRNNKMPQLVINEINTENSNPRTEFIEFKTLTAGNLGGMRVFINGNTNAAQETIYEFLPVNVQADEYIVLHLRTVEPEAIDEYDDDLTVSGGRNSSPTGRDLWIPGNTKKIHKAASAVYVMDQDDKVIDGVMISETPDAWWKKDYFAETADLLYQQGVWKSPSGKIATPADSISSSGHTATRTICRDETIEATNTANNWYVTVTSGLTPGRTNNEKRFSN